MLVGPAHKRINLAKHLSSKVRQLVLNTRRHLREDRSLHEPIMSQLPKRFRKRLLADALKLPHHAAKAQRLMRRVQNGPLCEIFRSISVASWQLYFGRLAVRSRSEAARR